MTCVEVKAISLLKSFRPLLSSVLGHCSVGTEFERETEDKTLTCGLCVVRAQSACACATLNKHRREARCLATTFFCSLCFWYICDDECDTQERKTQQKGKLTSWQCQESNNYSTASLG